MKDLKTLFVGFVMGTICMSAVKVSAVNVDVTAQLVPDTKFEFDEKQEIPPYDSKALMYESRIYVPVRYIAEKLGCKVDWDIATRTVKIDDSERKVRTEYIEKEVEKIVYVDKSEDPDYVSYSQMPASKKQDGYIVTVNMVTNYNSDNCSKVYVKLENLSNSKDIQILQSQSKLTVDGQEYPFKYMGTRSSEVFEDNLAARGDTIESYITFPKLPRGQHEFTLETKVRFDRIQDDEQTVIINFKGDMDQESLSN